MEKANTVLSTETQEALRHAIGLMMADVSNGDGDVEHAERTPERVVKAYLELFSGVGKDPAEVLRSSFKETSYNQLIIVDDIEFDSICYHHLLPFNGVVRFGYVPNKRVVGLSKIPRLVEVLSHRPQIQERLTQQLVDTFQSVVEPAGCMAVVEASHACVGVRGVRKPGAMMRTNALTGIFMNNPSLKEEFLMTVLRGK